MQDELQADLNELKQILPTLHRKGNQQLVESRVKVIEKEIKQLELKAAQKLQQEQSQLDQTIYTGITKYAWDQEGKTVKIRIQLDGIGQLSKDNFQIIFDQESVDLKIKNYNGQNLRYNVKKLNQKIKVPECSFKTTNNSVIIVLIKSEDKHWDQLPYKESPINPDKLAAKDADPQASLMNMMKEMYQNGDEDMKRTIAQAWTKSQDEKVTKQKP